MKEVEDGTGVGSECCSKDVGCGLVVQEVVGRVVDNGVSLRLGVVWVVVTGLVGG